jgi:type IV pilus assembly protein PilV
MQRLPNNRRQRGITIVESLVALIVLSVGMLGIAGLYVSSLKAQRTALTRTQAVSLVNDMIDRIRANPAARDAYDLAKKYSGNPQAQGCVDGAGNCTRSQLAQDDLARWRDEVKTELPNYKVMDVSVTTVAGGADRYQVRLEWLEPGEPANFSYQGNFSVLPVIP